VRIGIFQSDSAGLTPQQRVTKLAETIIKANVDLLVCPELFLSGYNVGSLIPEYAEARSGQYAAQIEAIAKASSTAIVYGYPEQHADALYNSAACIDANGQPIANHRKLMLPPGFESNYFVAGNHSTVFELFGFKVALLICYDAEFPETVRQMALAGAQLVIVPTALASQWGVVSEKLIPTRAFENGVWVAYANHAGQENGLSYYGGSCIVTPEGIDAARADFTECVIQAQLDLDSVLAAQERLPYLQGVTDLRNKLSK